MNEVIYHTKESHTKESTVASNQLFVTFTLLSSCLLKLRELIQRLLTNVKAAVYAIDLLSLRYNLASEICVMFRYSSLSVS